jgi:hypothetical protein
VYLSVLLQLRASIDELEILIDGHTFQGFPISEKWEAFWSILQPRWALMTVHLGREKEPAKSACDNMSVSTFADS